jgi:ribosome maturation factor RimP
MSPSPAAVERLRAVVTPVVEAEGFEVDALTITPAGRRSVVRLTVDADAGVDLDAVARVSRAVSDALDADGDAAFTGPYALEVSSPGVDRPLTEVRHWRRAAGRLVTVAVDGVARTARVAAVDGAGVVLRPPVAGAGSAATAAEAGADHVTWERLGAGRIQVEFTREEHTDESGSGPATGER